MNNPVLPIYLRLKEIPFILMVLTSILCFFGFVLLTISILPIGTYRTTGGVEVSLLGFWKDGWGLKIFTMGAYPMLLGLGFYFKQWWSRHLFVGSCLLFVLGVTPKSPGQINISFLLFILIIFVLPVSYLYLNKRVNEYFE